MEALSRDLQKKGFRNVVHSKKDEKVEKTSKDKVADSGNQKIEEHLLFLSFDDEKIILSEAMKHGTLIRGGAYGEERVAEINSLAQEKKDKMGISRVIIKNEQKQAISPDHAANPFDLYKYLSEADRVRLSFQILKRIRVIECAETESAFKKDGIAKIEDKELLFDFLNRHDIIKDIFCLKSRSQAVLRMLKFQKTKDAAPSDQEDGSIWRQASKNLFIDEETIREFYGE